MEEGPRTGVHLQLMVLYLVKQEAAGDGILRHEAGEKDHLERGVPKEDASARHVSGVVVEVIRWRSSSWQAG